MQTVVIQHGVRVRETKLNCAVQDQSPDSWSCRGLSPRWKSLTRLWCCFDWRRWSMVLFFALSVFKVLHIWPFTAWTLQCRGNDYTNGLGFCACWFARPGVFFTELNIKLCWADYLSSADVDYSKDVYIRVMRTHQHIIVDESPHSFLLWAQFRCTKSAYYFFLQPATSRQTSALLKVRIIIKKIQVLLMESCNFTLKCHV